MSDTFDSPGTGERRRVVAAAVLTAIIITTAVALLHGPAAELVLTGDSYQWIQHAHAATHRPALLLADLDSFLRPSTTWSLAIDRAIWGGFEARGFRTSSLAIHGLVALALVFAGRRLGLGSLAAAAVGLVWATSPFADESAFVVAYRFQPLLLLSWLVLIAVWPRAGEEWRRSARHRGRHRGGCRRRGQGDLGRDPGSGRCSRTRSETFAAGDPRPTLIVGIAVVVYVIVYFRFFPAGDKSYYEFGSHVVAKIPAQLAAFLYLKEPMPFALELSWQGVLATVAVAAMAGACLRWKVPGTWTALALYLLPTVPTLLVPFMPQRYLAIPYAGFLLLTALWVTAAAARLHRWRWPIRGAAVGVVVVVMAAGAAIVRSDLEDYRRISAAHEVLLAEAAAVSDGVAGGGPVLVVRDERAQPLLEILREPRGFAKLPYTRHADPYGLSTPQPSSSG